MLGVWAIVGVGVGLLLVAAGLALIVSSRRLMRSDSAVTPGGPTRLTAGLVCMFVGYHSVIWSLPAKWSMVSVPPDRWWIVVAVGVVAIAGALLADRLESRGGG